MSDELEAMLSGIRKLVLDAQAERDRYGYIAATIRINALRHGATDAEAEGMVRGETDFIAWLAKKVESKADCCGKCGSNLRVTSGVNGVVYTIACGNCGAWIARDPYGISPNIRVEAQNVTP